MISFSRTALSVLQLTSYHFGAHTGSDHPEVHSAGPKTQLDFAPEKLIDVLSSKTREARRTALLTEREFLLDGIGIIIFAAYNLMRLVLMAIGIQNIFRMRDVSHAQEFAPPTWKREPVVVC